MRILTELSGIGGGDDDLLVCAIDGDADRRREAGGRALNRTQRVALPLAEKVDTVIELAGQSLVTYMVPANSSSAMPPGRYKPVDAPASVRSSAPVSALYTVTESLLLFATYNSRVLEIASWLGPFRPLVMVRIGGTVPSASRG